MKVIAVTGPLPDDILKHDFDDSELHKHGMIFDDGEFVSYADMTVGHLEALALAQRDEADLVMQEVLVDWLRLPPDERQRAFAKLSPEEQAEFDRWLWKFSELEEGHP